MGMNTNDIRNMRLNQWVFWAVAIPLTSVVITLCLLWAGELANFTRAVAGLWRGRRRGYGGGYGVGRAGYAGGREYVLAKSRFVDEAEVEEVEVGRERERERRYPRVRVSERSDLYGNRSFAYV